MLGNTQYSETAKHIWSNDDTIAELAKTLSIITPFDKDITETEVRAKQEECDSNYSFACLIVGSIEQALELSKQSFLPPRQTRYVRDASEQISRVDAYASYLDICLHNDIIERPNVRSIVNKHVKITEHDLEVLLRHATNTTDMRRAAKDETRPKLWRCVKSLCGIEVERSGQIPHRIEQQIIRIAFDDTSPQSDSAAGILRYFTGSSGRTGAVRPPALTP